jgi:hypothetical protein
MRLSEEGSDNCTNNKRIINNYSIAKHGVHRRMRRMRRRRRRHVP